MPTPAVSAPPASRVRRLRPVPAFVSAVLGAAVIGSLGSWVVAAIAHAAGVSQDFQALQVGTFSFFVVVGVLAGATGWQLIRRRAADPARLLGRLVPAVLVVSFVPDVLLHVAGAAHATWGAVTALMVMHVLVAVVAAAAYHLLLPVQRLSAAAVVRPGRG